MLFYENDELLSYLGSRFHLSHKWHPQLKWKQTPYSKLPNKISYHKAPLLVIFPVSWNCPEHPNVYVLRSQVKHTKIGNNWHNIWLQRKHLQLLRSATLINKKQPYFQTILIYSWFLPGKHLGACLKTWHWSFGEQTLFFPQGLMHSPFSQACFSGQSSSLAQPVTEIIEKEN